MEIKELSDMACKRAKQKNPKFNRKMQLDAACEIVELSGACNENDCPMVNAYGVCRLAKERDDER